MKTITYDTVIIGGGAAGLAAATVLARAHKKVTIIDNKQQSNHVSHGAHAVFTRDKTSPKELYKIAREQLLQYPLATVKDDTATDVTKTELFNVRLESGDQITGRSIVLAQGVTYELPDIPGLHKMWGNKVWHCPYCNGYEATGKKLLAIVEVDKVAHWKKLLPMWTNTVVYKQPDEISELIDNEQGIAVRLKDGTTIQVDEALAQTAPKPRDNLADMLGCKRTPQGHVLVDEMNMTTVDNVYSAGDQSSMMQQVNIAVAAGHIAGIAITMKLPLSGTGSS